MFQILKSTFPSTSQAQRNVSAPLKGKHQHKLAQHLWYFVCMPYFSLTALKKTVQPLIVQKNLVNLPLMFNKSIILTGMVQQPVETACGTQLVGKCSVSCCFNNIGSIISANRNSGKNVRNEIFIWNFSCYYGFSLQWRCTFWEMRNQSSATKSPVRASSIFGGNDYDVISWGSHQITNSVNLNQPWFNLPFRKG